MEGFKMFGMEGMFDLNKNGRMDGFERAAMHEFLMDNDRKSRKKTSRFSDSFDDDDNSDDGDFGEHY